MDAAVASCLCIGLINSFSAGIGGGGFMTIRLPNGTVEVIDFRETAPAASTPLMYKHDPILAQKGGLSVAVPGEIRGLELAHQRHGRLPWQRLFKPIVKMAREGWAVGPELARRLQLVKKMIEKEPSWSQVFAPAGSALREGEWVKRKALAKTLETIGKEGADAFYTGEIAQIIVDYVQANGGILTMDDMRNYKPLVKEPVVGFYQGRKVYTTPAPTSGPVLISMLNILERYNVGKFKEDADVETHRFVEAMKFGFAQRTELGDPDFTDLGDKIINMMSKDTAASIRANISDTRTFPVDYYNPHWGSIDNHGTTHLSTVDEDDMSVALTSTVNLLFGSKLMEPKTGIILNDEMDDFSIPGRANAFGLQPSPFNYPEPGKRPLSSCVPTIVEKDGKFEMSLGGSGGSRIITAVLQTMLNVYNYNQNIMDAIENPRIHHQLMPNVVDIEEGYPTSEIQFLQDVIGHNVTTFNRLLAKAEVQAVMRETDGFIYASSDTRKHGIAAGY
ncbi:gamma-glutamyltranspeptidase [Lobosporangium transversale]|uniref:Gamma-glutamyltranspeptidase n=1 Tax=Lobosporangium transversale TaxID=64571 RepID=A0A1Y2GD30_9FUNG|nr:gamma-glutamyltranspeptidase [Lobosporangium transversale]ORZ07500.1 gamma-glutamyltranspeptidase [Lobosporangium transversale]|eukprot:XP_021878007.1 gamma-glutamyltranspeptidase [Lobosporangium transversale]